MQGINARKVSLPYADPGELLIHIQVDICILDTILMLANLGPGIWTRVWGVGNCWGVCPDCYNDVTSFTF